MFKELQIRPYDEQKQSYSHERRCCFAEDYVLCLQDHVHWVEGKVSTESLHH